VNREPALKILMVLVGLFFLAGFYPLATSLRQADKWDGDEMMFSIYATLGFSCCGPQLIHSMVEFLLTVLSWVCWPENFWQQGASRRP
jgi:hypothetical protein